MHRDEPIRVLAVDDDQGMVELTAASLERADERLRVSTETDPTAVTDRLGSGSFDCLVTDYEMPRLDGIELTESVRSSHPDLPVVLFTGRSGEVPAAALSAGATDYLRKGGDEQYTLLANRVTNAVTATRADRERRAALGALDAPAEGVALIDERGHFARVNDAYAAVLGGSPERLRGQAFVDQYPGDASDHARTALSAARETGDWTGELPTVDGDEVIVATHRLRAVAGGYVACTLEDRGDRDDERRLKRLHAVTRELMSAPGEAVPERAVEFARDVLDLPVTVVACYEDGDLEPVAYTDEAEPLLLDLPSFTGGHGIARDAFETGHPSVVDDARAAGSTADPDTEVRSVGVFPLGEHGVIVTGSRDPGRLDGTDADLGRLLAASVETALDRLERERDLRDRSAELVETSRTLEAVIEAVPVPVIALDEDGAVDLWNRAAERTFGWSAEEVIGDPLPILPDDVGFDSTLDPMLAGEVVRGERVVRETADGERRHFRLFNAPRHDADGSVGGAIGALLDVTEQREYRERLDALHETARDLMHAESHEAVARVASDALAETLGHSFNAVRFADEERGLLEVVAVNESALGAAETRPDYDIDDTPAGEAYREERPVRSTVDPTESDHIVSAHRLYVPIPGYGVLGIGSGEEPPTDAESDLAEVLAANVEAALDRLEREAELTRQNERLEEFASVVSHDLRAPLNVAQGRLSMAAGATDDDEAQLDAVADAHDRMERLIEGLLTLARDGGAVDDRERVDVGAVAEDVWATVDAAGATLTVEDPGTVEAAPDRFRQLLGNLLRNAAEHGVADGTANGDSGSTVRVGGLDDGAGFFVADDGPGLADPERAFEWGYTTEGSGTGLGLAIVRELSEAHGWSVVADGDGEASGARIEIRTD